MAAPGLLADRLACSTAVLPSRTLIEIYLGFSWRLLLLAFNSDRMWMALDHVRPHLFEIDVGFRFHLLAFWAAIADVRFWSPAFMRNFSRTCQPKRLLQRLRAQIAV
jgi:hypothetical protein